MILTMCSVNCFLARLECVEREAKEIIIYGQRQKQQNKEKKEVIAKKVRENNTKYSSYLHERQDLGTRRERQAG